MPAHRAPATGLRPRPAEGDGVSRRRFLGYLIAAPTLVVAAEMGRQTVFGAPEASAAPIPSVQTTELYDLSDAIRDAARPTANLIKIEVNRDGTVSFAMPRSDNGQGIITSTQMIIAEEMDLELDQVVVTLADARPELVFNQLTGGSSATFTLFTPVRVAAALARGRLLDAAAAVFDQDAGTLSSRAGVITSLTGGTLGIGELAEKAAVQTTEQVEVVLKPREEFRILGKPQTKTDARAIVTGKKQFATDLQIPDALPSVVCRAPDLNGAPSSIDNIDEIRSMPGVTDVEIIATGVAVRAATFGQCIDAVRAMTVQWEPGTVAGEDDESVLAGLRAAELPLAVPPAGGSTVEGDFTFYFKSNSSLETNCALADVRSGSAEMWFPTKTPITAQDQIADLLGMPNNAVTVHVTEGGGSFGRKLFFDAALEAAEFSQKIGKPVKLMWTRSDDSRQGRVHPMATSRVRASVTADSVLSFELRHTSVSMDVSHGFGDALTVAASRLPAGNLAVAEVIWELSQTVPYNFGVSTRLLNEVDMRFNTGPMRNVYSPDSTVARELMVDQIAAKMDRDPYEFRREFLKHDRQRAVLDKVAEEGNWGRSMEEGTAQGISFQTEYKSVIAALVEIDCRPETVNRSVREGLTGPRVTKVTVAVDVGVVINPRGIEAQILGAINDALAMTLTGSLSLVDGHFVEASWDNYFYTRQWNTPPEVNFHLVESDAPEPGGVGELGVGGATGAIACAYARATGKIPEYFPIMHKEPRPFEPYPTVPPIPPSPTNGLDTTF